MMRSYGTQLQKLIQACWYLSVASLSLCLAATLSPLVRFVSLLHSFVSFCKPAFLIVLNCACGQIWLPVHPSVTQQLQYLSLLDQVQSLYLSVQRFERIIIIGPWPIIGFKPTAPSLISSSEVLSWSRFPRKRIWAVQVNRLIDLLYYSLSIDT